MPAPLQQSCKSCGLLGKLSPRPLGGRFATEGCPLAESINAGLSHCRWAVSWECTKSVKAITEVNPKKARESKFANAANLSDRKI